MQAIVTREGKEVEFDKERIRNAIKKAFNSQSISNESLCKELTDQVVRIVESKFEQPSVEQVQDIVETVLILNHQMDVAKAYILYRNKRQTNREEKVLEEIKEKKLMINYNGKMVAFDSNRIKEKLEKLSFGLNNVDIPSIVDEASKTVYNNIEIDKLSTIIVNAIKTRIEKHYDYSTLAARTVLNQIYKETLGEEIFSENFENAYKTKFLLYIENGIQQGLLTPEIKDLDLEKLLSITLSSILIVVETVFSNNSSSTPLFLIIFEKFRLAKLQTAVSSLDVFRVISVQRFELCTTPT